MNAQKAIAFFTAEVLLFHYTGHILGHSKIVRVYTYYLYCMWLPLLTSLQI